MLPTNDYERKQIATVSYTFATATAANSNPESPFCILDNGTAYGISYIKAAADDISAKGATSQYYAQFKGYLDSGMDPGTDDAQGFVKWGDGATYNVRIIGINHDDKADGSGKAGLTFQFVDLLNDKYSMNPSRDTQGGWRDCALRASMQPGGALYAQVPDSLKDSIAIVSKSTSNSDKATAAISVTEDHLFLASTTEVFGAATQGKYEGSRYAYWTPAVATIDIAKASFTIKYRQGTMCAWLLRTVCDTTSGLWKALGSQGTFQASGVYGSEYAESLAGVCPAFCL